LAEAGNFSRPGESQLALKIGGFRAEISKTSSWGTSPGVFVQLIDCRIVLKRAGHEQTVVCTDAIFFDLARRNTVAGKKVPYYSHGDCQETLCVPFFLDDGTGTLLIDPRGVGVGFRPFGLVEVSGTATGPYSVISPLSKTECYFYRAILPRQRPTCNRVSQRMLSAALRTLDEGTLWIRSLRRRSPKPRKNM
jgi:hypothetical protein